MIDTFDFKIGDIICFKNEDPPISVEYYGIVVDKSDIHGEFCIKWFNHQFIDSDIAQKYRFDNTYNYMWSVVS